MDPRLPSSIADCEGLPRSQWITKKVLLKDNKDDSVAIGVCHSVCRDLVLGSDGPIGSEQGGCSNYRCPRSQRHDFRLDLHTLCMEYYACIL